jgi:hypothetical protein
VSDFLGRVAARAVGQAALAQPRLPPLFAPAETVAPDDGLEAVSTAEAPAPRGVLEPAHVREATNVTPRTPPRATEPDVAAVRARLPAQPALAVSAAERAAREPDGAAEPRRAAEPPAVRAPGELETPQRAAEPAVALPALTVVATPIDVYHSVPPLAPVARDDAPPVRVHIGRLEIRANVQEPPRPQPAPRESRRAEELSLGDYLRGRRDAG